MNPEGNQIYFLPASMLMSSSAHSSTRNMGRNVSPKHLLIFNEQRVVISQEIYFFICIVDGAEENI
jgi:hypothetical protein